MSSKEDIVALEEDDVELLDVSTCVPELPKTAVSSEKIGLGEVHDRATPESSLNEGPLLNSELQADYLPAEHLDQSTVPDVSLNSATDGGSSVLPESSSHAPASSSKKIDFGKLFNRLLKKSPRKVLSRPQSTLSDTICASDFPSYERFDDIIGLDEYLQTATYKVPPSSPKSGNVSPKPISEDSEITSDNAVPLPAEDKPAEDKPAKDKPAEDKPADDKPPTNSYNEIKIKELMDKLSGTSFKRTPVPSVFADLSINNPNSEKIWIGKVIDGLFRTDSETELSMPPALPSDGPCSCEIDPQKVLDSEHQSMSNAAPSVFADLSMNNPYAEKIWIGKVIDGLFRTDSETAPSLPPTLPSDVPCSGEIEPKEVLDRKHHPVSDAVPSVFADLPINGPCAEKIWLGKVIDRLFRKDSETAPSLPPALPSDVLCAGEIEPKEVLDSEPQSVSDAAEKKKGLIPKETD